ncbi:MAG: hypothetical protein KatS3mg051_1274 [Anaerolineae bacterium]|nr:MAG: hypothetical protein KatS3mg051_1274 [Anaerolineae bacterium]
MELHAWQQIVPTRPSCSPRQPRSGQRVAGTDLLLDSRCPDAATYQLEISTSRELQPRWCTRAARLQHRSRRELCVAGRQALLARARRDGERACPDVELTRYLTIDTTGPTTARCSARPEQAASRARCPPSAGMRVSDAREYHLQVATEAFSPACASSTVNRTTTSYTACPPLDFGTYFWRVQAKDKLGNWGAWSDPSAST